MMARVGAKESFDEGRQDLEELAGVRVTTERLGVLLRLLVCRLRAMQIGSVFKS
jgi:hypothetical protein